jgi:uncharacterized LabA/DUF88 family protein
MNMNVLGTRPEERVSVYIDGPNLYATSRALGVNLDYKKLLKNFKEAANLIRLNYFTAVFENSVEYNSIRPLLDWLDYNGYMVHEKPAKEFTDSAGRRKVRGNVAIDMSVHMMESASHLDHIFLFSGDGDFLSTVFALQRMGVRVTVISTLLSPGDNPMVSDELRRAADQFIDLNSILSVVGQDEKDSVRSTTRPVANNTRPRVVREFNEPADAMEGVRRAVSYGNVPA